MTVTWAVASHRVIVVTCMRDYIREALPFGHVTEMSGSSGAYRRDLRDLLNHSRPAF